MVDDENLREEEIKSLEEMLKRLSESSQSSESPAPKVDTVYWRDHGPIGDIADFIIAMAVRSGADEIILEPIGRRDYEGSSEDGEDLPVRGPGDIENPLSMRLRRYRGLKIDYVIKGIAETVKELPWYVGMPVIEKMKLRCGKRDIRNILRRGEYRTDFRTDFIYEHRGKRALYNISLVEPSAAGEGKVAFRLSRSEQGF